MSGSSEKEEFGKEFIIKLFIAGGKKKKSIHSFFDGEMTNFRPAEVDGFLRGAEK